MHESCGIFGIYAPGVDVARITFFALYALQHRGQESAGIATAEEDRIYIHTDMGLVSHAFNEEELARLKGNIAIGHNRYSTTGSSVICNAQPVLVGTMDIRMALGHNGNITNSSSLRVELEEKGYDFNSTTDSEIIANLILSAPEKEIEGKIKYAMRRLQGAYSLVILANEKLYGVRDPMGVRPLCVGSLDGGWVLASETCALDHIGAQYIREIEPGEIVTIDGNGVRSTRIESGRKALCIFEYIYFARPDSLLNGKLIYTTRERMGAILSREHPVQADMVMGIPDSATAAGIGYARASGIPYHEGLLKNRYVGRTFIEPDQRLRELGVRLKFNPLTQEISGKRLVVVDDSIVRGTTTPRVINMLRKAGAREVHMRICAPPIRYPCFFGVDMATRWELIAAQKSVSEIKDTIGADSLGYISMEGLIEAVDQPSDIFCVACFTGEYPMPVQLEMDKLQLETLPSASSRSLSEIET
ncbi:MAG: amidophosphoribosyltransferase [Dehalococcoidia bacterium]|nr:amidophosphoribosyltransferase [Dehalococcoidia bacterium]MDD5495072.1 amidophosphoribosyltransferase [Dehalococcoidia bacterium]